MSIVLTHSSGRSICLLTHTYEFVKRCSDNKGKNYHDLQTSSDEICFVVIPHSKVWAESRFQKAKYIIISVYCEHITDLALANSSEDL